MSEASRELEQKTGGEVPSADETIAATADEVVETGSVNILRLVSAAIRFAAFSSQPGSASSQPSC